MSFAHDIDRDVLIARVVDGEAGSADWNALKDLAAKDQSIWGELAETQRTHDELTRAVERATASAAYVELPEPEPVVNVTQRRLDVISKFGGWAAAAAIVLVGFLGLRMPQFQRANTQSPQQVVPASIVPLGPSTPEEAANRYLSLQDDPGQFVREVPNSVFLGAEQAESGRARVYTLRQFVVVREVDGVLEWTRDEFGNPVQVPARLPETGGAF